MRLHKMLWFWENLMRVLEEDLRNFLEIDAEQFTPGVILDIRKILGMTKEEMASLLHIRIRTLASWERGASKPESEGECDCGCDLGLRLWLLRKVKESVFVEYVKRRGKIEARKKPKNNVDLKSPLESAFN